MGPHAQNMTPSLNVLFEQKIQVIIAGSPSRGPFKNHVDNRGWVGGLKFANFVHVQYIKNVHEGRWVVKKEQNYVHVVFE